jgi:hypothetical protein
VILKTGQTPSIRLFHYLWFAKDDDFLKDVNVAALYACEL